MLLLPSGCSLWIPGGLWMVAVISWWALDGYCYFLVGTRSIHVLGVQEHANMQTCRHADIKRTKKAKQKKIPKAGFESRNLRTRTYCNYQLSYIRIYHDCNIRVWMS